VTEEKIALYNRHKMERGLTTGDGLIDAEGYEQFLARECTDTIEIRYVLNGLLVAWRSPIAPPSTIGGLLLLRFRRVARLTWALIRC
jgi:hypothetical protein